MLLSDEVLDSFNLKSDIIPLKGGQNTSALVVKSKGCCLIVNSINTKPAHP